VNPALESRRRSILIANAVVLVAAVLSIGQVRYEMNKDRDTASVIDSTPLPGGDAPVVGAGSPVTIPGAKTSTAPGKKGGKAGTPTAGTPTSPGSVPGGSTPGTPTTTNPNGGVNTPPVVRRPSVPDFGLRTQGVTSNSVLIGADYNKTGCGGADALSNQLGEQVTGDPEKAFKAFVRYINETGGIRGKTLKLVTVDDGGLYCPEKHQAAAIELVEEKKVFLDIAGLHEISDLLAAKHLPFYGGRSTLAEQHKQGYGQFQLFQEAEGEFANWAGFARNYLNSKANAPCLIHPNTEDFNNLEGYLKRALSKEGLKFADTVAYDDNPATAQQQATTYSIRMKPKCKQVWLIANNAIADIFFTNAAYQQNWFPTWTWTSRTALIDTKLGGSLMQQDEWEKSVGLTTRIKPGQSPYEGNCKKIYDRYYAGDGKDESAAVIVACASVIPVAEAMRRAIDITGSLTGNSLMLGVDALRGDVYWDAYVPMTYSVPDLDGPFDFTGFDFQTVARWNRNRANPNASDYAFPEFPRYWKVLGPNKSGSVDIRAWLRKRYTPPKK
jgi:hypothetical protein